MQSNRIVLGLLVVVFCSSYERTLVNHATTTNNVDCIGIYPSRDNDAAVSVVLCNCSCGSNITSESFCLFSILRNAKLWGRKLWPFSVNAGTQFV